MGLRLSKMTIKTISFEEVTPRIPLEIHRKLKEKNCINHYSERVRETNSLILRIEAVFSSKKSILQLIRYTLQSLKYLSFSYA
jgi:hypothetical protein